MNQVMTLIGLGEYNLSISVEFYSKKWMEPKVEESVLILYAFAVTGGDSIRRLVWAEHVLSSLLGFLAIWKEDDKDFMEVSGSISGCILHCCWS